MKLPEFRIVFQLKNAISVRISVQKLCLPVCAAFRKFCLHRAQFPLVLPIVLFNAKNTLMLRNLFPAPYQSFRTVLMELVYGQVMVKQFQGCFFREWEHFFPCITVFVHFRQANHAIGKRIYFRLCVTDRQGCTERLVFNPVCQYLRQLFRFLVIVQLVPIIYNQVSFIRGKHILPMFYTVYDRCRIFYPG